jgi:hypothetical protein
MASGEMTYTPSFIKIGLSLSFQKLLGWKRTHAHARTHTEQGGLTRLFSFFHNKEIRLEILSDHYDIDVPCESRLYGFYIELLIYDYVHITVFMLRSTQSYI